MSDSFPIGTRVTAPDGHGTLHGEVVPTPDGYYAPSAQRNPLLVHVRWDDLDGRLPTPEHTSNLQRETQ
jgi:hypothetical protein